MDRSPSFVVPIPIKNPFAFLLDARKTGNFLPKFLRARRLGEMHAGKAVSPHVEVHVSVIEPRNHAAPIQLHDSRCRASKLEDRLSVTNGHDAVSFDS